MKKLSEIPFINVSKENLMAAGDLLDREQKGELLEMIIDAVLNDSSPTSNSKCVSGVFNQFMAVINRKAEKCINRAKGIEEYNRKRSEAKSGNNQVIPQEEVDEHNAVPEAKIKNTELPEVERWAIAVIQNKDGKGQEYFYKYWEKYFDSEDQADIYISNYETKVI